MNLGVIVLYAPREYACEITGEVIGLYCQIVEDLDHELEYTLYQVISCMVDAFFDDEYDNVDYCYD